MNNFGHYLENGKDINEAVLYANAVAALTVSKKGASESVPTAKEVEEFLLSADPI